MVKPRYRRIRDIARGAAVLLAGTAAALSMAPSAAGGGTMAARLPAPVPAISDFLYMTGSQIPPTEANCMAAGRRCFTPASMQASYNLGPLYALKDQGQGVTIAIIDSFGDPNIESDLQVFNTAMSLPHMCGEPGTACGTGMPAFRHVFWDGTTIVKAPPQNSNGTGIQTRNIWALETALDVEWAHSIAPMANILNVTTNPAETLGVQGFPQMMDAEQFIVDNHLATVISQSFSAAEETFASTQSLLNLRHAFVSAAANGVTVLASSGDGGTANSSFTPVPNPVNFPFPTVGWPASDPLVTGVGGTYLCTDPVTGTGVDSTDPPTRCKNQPNREVGWIDSGGGFSHVFAAPDYQSALPAGSTQIGLMRGVPDISYQASALTGVLVYDTAPGDATSGLNCAPGDPCSAGWFVVGGTSSGCPQWAALVAIADQIAGRGLGLINPRLYALAAGPDYGSYFYDVTTGNNQADPSIPGYPATVGWDPVTGLGTPNAADLLPALGG
ncbi:MAG TPA: S53 family peptidase [Streptosporangiaceae bacterium]|nr:S53 family peptidase [Streptosporangiaceae bacterium]